MIGILIRFPVHTLDSNLDEFRPDFHTNGLPSIVVVMISRRVGVN